METRNRISGAPCWQSRISFSNGIINPGPQALKHLMKCGSYVVPESTTHKGGDVSLSTLVEKAKRFVCRVFTDCGESRVAQPLLAVHCAASYKEPHRQECLCCRVSL